MYRRYSRRCSMQPGGRYSVDVVFCVQLSKAVVLFRTLPETPGSKVEVHFELLLVVAMAKTFANQ
jgi:hypothetical protein